MLLRGRGIATLICSPLGRARTTAEIVSRAIGLPILCEEALHEASFGVNEAKPIFDAWFADWIAGRATPEGAESFAALRERAVQAVNRALTHPAPVLVVAHGSLFRALRAEMGLDPSVRLANATPQLCEPPPRPGTPWTLTPATQVAG